MIITDDGNYDYVDAYVGEDGITLEYKCSELPIAGSDMIDDPEAVNWSDNDIRDVVALHLGIIEGSNEIDVIFN